TRTLSGDSGRRQLAAHFLSHAVPCATIGAFSKPFRGLATALLAGKDSLLFHGNSSCALKRGIVVVAGNHVNSRWTGIRFDKAVFLYIIFRTKFTQGTAMEFYRPPSLQGALDTLGSVYRALRAWKFYPKGHPSRKSSIKQAHAAMLQLLDGNNLSLVCGRTGFSFPDGEQIKDATRMSSSLSYELFIRRVQKITFLSDLYQEDLLDFLRLLTIPPDTVQKAGGMDKLMADHGIRTIWANEFDLSILNVRRRDVEFMGNTPPGLDEVE